MTYTAGGLAIFKNCIAVKDTFKKDTTYFHNFTAFGKTAETMANFLHKGSKALIEGQLTQSSYEKDGQKRTSTDVIVDRFEFLDSKKDEQQAPSQATGCEKCNKGVIYIETESWGLVFKQCPHCSKEGEE